LQAVRDQDGALGDPVQLLRRRALHLEHDVAVREHGLGSDVDLRAGALVIRVGETGSGARPGFDQHLDPGAHHLLHRRRNGGHPLLAFHALFQDGHSHEARGRGR